ncbi:chorismate mutase [Bacillus sp. CDB3]|uniref:chorismate mutase n=1 Tax=Bacillus sp. CDB3 TaxID=360310 RepID=UPI00100815E2|nr:chorismate mutase [Bacillus sp. CDB3]
MHHMSFERPTDHYDEHLSSIDEKICSLLKERKELSNGNPGFPPDEAIYNWAKQYGFYPDYLNSLFSSMMDEEEFKPRVEPAKFQKHIPVFKTYEHKGIMYTVTFIRQYSNASIVYLYSDWDSTNEVFNEDKPHSFFQLSIDDTYDCWSEGGGGGTDGHMSHHFVVSPALPDNPYGISLQFKYRNMPMKYQTVLEFEIQLD